MRNNTYHILAILLLLWVAKLGAQTPANDPNWIQTPGWHDEFTGNDINSTYWTVRNYYDHFYYRNITTNPCDADSIAEGQVFRNRKRLLTKEPDQNVVYDYEVRNNVLKLLLHHEDCDCPSYARTPNGCSMQYYHEQCSSSVPLYHFTGAEIMLNNDYIFKYGYLEAKIKLNCGNGFFPAFWLYGVNYGSTHQGTDYQEVDVFEMTYGNIEDSGIVHDQNVMTSNIHYTDTLVNKSLKQIISDYRNYHVYGLEWTPSKLIYYVDNYIYRIEKNNGIFDPKKIILTFAVHKDNVDALENYFPGIMEVDYVRLYKPRTDYNTVLNMNNYNFSNHDNRVKKKITMSGNNNLQITDNVYLRATDGVEIYGDFTVPIGAELYIDVNSAY